MALRLYSRVKLKRSLCDDDGTLVPEGAMVVPVEDLGSGAYRAEVHYPDDTAPSGYRTVAIAVMETEVEPV